MGRAVRGNLSVALALGLAMLAQPALAKTAPAKTAPAAKAAANPVPPELAAVLASKRFAAAREALRLDHPRMIEQLVTLTEVPAPPFGEAERGSTFAALLRGSGLPEVTTDAVGNVIAVRKGTDPKAAPLLVAAHIDTVFPAGTDVKVKRKGTRLMAPGIGDDTRALAVMLSIIRALDKAGIRTKRDVVFIGNVGEEGPGDLRGTRHLFAQDARAKAAAGFITIDGAGQGLITTQGVGSRRYRLTFSGPGGHSYGKFGIVNPMAALAGTVTGLYAVPVPQDPRTTYSASVVGGGTSVNTIPNEVFLEVDIRSVAPAEVDRVDAALKEIAARAVDQENAARDTSGGKVSVTFKPIGDRPAGSTPEDSALVRIAFAAARAQGIESKAGSQSTDANVPMSLGIPAIAIGSGGSGGDAHAPSEWIDVAEGPSLAGITAAMATILGAAGIER